MYRDDIKRREHKLPLLGWDKPSFALKLQAADSILRHLLIFRGKVKSGQVGLQHGAQCRWRQRCFSQHPTNCLFPTACHTMSPPTTLPSLKLSHSHSADTCHGRHIGLESSVLGWDWIPKCHLSLSLLLFPDLSRSWTSPFSQVSRTWQLFQQETP